MSIKNFKELTSYRPVCNDSKPVIQRICFNKDGTRMAFSCQKSEIGEDADEADLHYLHFVSFSDLNDLKNRDAYTHRYLTTTELAPVRSMCFVSNVCKDALLFLTDDSLQFKKWYGTDLKVVDMNYGEFHGVEDEDELLEIDEFKMEYNEKHNVLATAGANENVELRILKNAPKGELDEDWKMYGKPIIINTSDDFVSNVSFSPDEDMMMTSQMRGHAFWDFRVPKKEKIVKLFHLEIEGRVQFIPGNSNMVVSMESDEDKKIKLWNLESKSVEKSFNHSISYVSDCSISADGAVIVLCKQSQNVYHFMNLSSGKIKKAPKQEGIDLVAFHPTKKNILFTNTIEDYIPDDEHDEHDEKCHWVTAWEVSNIYDSSKKSIRSASAKRSLRDVESVELPSDIDDPFMTYDEMKHETQKVQSADGNPAYKIHPLDTDKFKFTINNEDFPIMFVHGNSMNVIAKSKLERIIRHRTTIVYECLSSLPEDASRISYDDLKSNVRYVQTSKMALSSGLTGLIKLSDIQDILNDTPKIRIKQNQKKKIEELDELSRSDKPLEEKRERAKKLLNDANLSPRIYMIKEVKSKGKPKVVKRIVSESVLQGGSVVSGHHCQSGRNFPVYTLKEVKKANNKTRKSKSPNKRKSRKVRSV